MKPESIKLDVPQPMAASINEFWGEYGGPNYAMFAQPVCEHGWKLRLAMFDERESEQIQALLLKIAEGRKEK